MIFGLARDYKAGENRTIATPREIASIVKAASIACRAFSNILGRIRVGMTEMDVKIALNYEMLALGSEGEAFDTIACAGENGSLPHAVAGRRVLKSGELLTLDFGATVDGYRSDMTRTVGIGHIGKDLRALYEAVLEAQLLALPAVKPGAVCEDVDRIARDFLEARYPGAFGHALGHGVGLFIHEQPRLGDQPPDRLGRSVQLRRQRHHELLRVLVDCGDGHRSSSRSVVLG